MMDSFQNEFFMDRIDLATGNGSVVQEKVAGPTYWIKPRSSIVVYLPLYSIVYYIALLTIPTLHLRFKHSY